MIQKTKSKHKPLFQIKQLSKKYKLKYSLYYKLAKFFLISLLLSILIFFMPFFNIITEQEIEKEISKIEPNYNSLNWNNVKKDFELLVDKYKYLLKNEKNIDEKSPIWIMWFQGIEKAPQIVKSCVQSIINNRDKHPVYIINKFNLENYVKLPSFILEKFNNRTFSITHFSDIVRFALLFKYGGYWIDSTYFITSPLKKVNTNYFTLKLDYCFTNSHPFIKCLWSGNFMAVSKNSFIATYGYMAFLFYWKKYNSLIDYFLIDYIIHIAYNKVTVFKDIIGRLPYIRCNIFSLEKCLNSDYKTLDLKCYFNKLSKKTIPHLYNSNNLTNYGYIIENYKLNMKFIK